MVLVQEGRLWLGPEYGLCVPVIPPNSSVLRITMQQHCNIRGYIPHGHNRNISLNHKWKYYRGKSHYVLDPQNWNWWGNSFETDGEQFQDWFTQIIFIFYSAFNSDRSSVMRFRNKNWGDDRKLAITAMGRTHRYKYLSQGKTPFVYLVLNILVSKKQWSAHYTQQLKSQGL